MKILQIAPYVDPRLGGQERYVLALYRALSSFGHEVTILTCQSPLVTPQNLRISRIHAVKLLGLRIISPNGLISFLLNNQFDICHLHHQTIFGEIVLLATKICKLPTVTTLHSQMMRRMPAKLLYDRISLRLVSTLSSKVICLSPKIMQNLTKRGVEYSKCVVIPNAVNVLSLKDQFQKTHSELHEPKFDLLFVGRLEKRKGILWLLKSLILLHRRGKKVTLKIVGHGPLTKKCNDMISANNLNQHVDLLGYVPQEELLKLFLLTRCVVIPSLYEGVPSVALEAMTAGKPLIASNIPGLAELVVDGGNGLLVNPMDVKELASAIDRILTTCLSSLSDINGKLLARFDWEYVASEITQIYHDAINRCD